MRPDAEADLAGMILAASSPIAAVGGGTRLRPGEGASVKFDAYDSSIYGSGEGRVTYISADTLTERYKIEVEPGDTGYELLEKAGRKRGFLMRGAQVDTLYGKATVRAADNQMVIPNYVARVKVADGVLRPVIEQTYPAIITPAASPLCKM